MFVAPLLYIIHALLTGISVFLVANMEWMAGFGFSAGLVDMVLSSRNPLAKQWYMLIFQGLAFFAVYYFVFLALIKGFDLKTPGREAIQSQPRKRNATKKVTEELAQQYIVALGGAVNLESVDACITRLRVTLKNRNLINEATLKSIGAMGVVKLGEHNLQVIIGPQAETIAEGIKALK
ncbi:glucose PTS transporter subunit EIIB [Psychromonas sp. KJ10-10]|uniref:glucose PTS transporter subunit EIIB n=1 Tax=Psychromonas sp. KJ10-10 TaxID=3391823 RepID=UPI0039B65B9B